MTGTDESAGGDADGGVDAADADPATDAAEADPAADAAAASTNGDVADADADAATDADADAATDADPAADVAEADPADADAADEATARGAALCDLLADERTRSVLATVADEPLPVKSVAERSDVSTATVYRRVSDLVDHDLLAEETRIDDEGNHYTVYRSKVERIAVSVVPADGRVTVDLTYRDAADQFVRLWEGLKE